MRKHDMSGANSRYTLPFGFHVKTIALPLAIIKNNPWAVNAKEPMSAIAQAWIRVDHLREKKKKA